MLADAEVLKEAGGRRLVAVAQERMAIEQHPAAREHPSGQRHRSRVEQHHIDRVGREMLRRDARGLETHERLVGRRET